MLASPDRNMVMLFHRGMLIIPHTICFMHADGSVIRPTNHALCSVMNDEVVSGRYR